MIVVDVRRRSVALQCAMGAPFDMHAAVDMSYDDGDVLNIAQLCMSSSPWCPTVSDDAMMIVLSIRFDVNYVSVGVRSLTLLYEVTYDVASPYHRRLTLTVADRTSDPLVTPPAGVYDARTSRSRGGGGVQRGRC